MVKTMKELRTEFEADPRRRAKIDAYERAFRDVLGLASLRESLGITQEELAKRIGFSQERVSKIERQPDLTLSTLEKVATGLGGDLEVSIAIDGHRVALSIPKRHTGDTAADAAGD